MGRTTKEFVLLAQKAHNNQYDYSKTDYVNSRTKVIVTCKEHSDFKVVPNNHINGAQTGCPKCSYKRAGLKTRVEKDSFIEKMKKIYGNKYDYSKVDYVKGDIEVIIICQIHSEFSKKPNYLLRKHGCPQCWKEVNGKKHSLNNSKFIAKAIKVHGDKYDYSKVKYVNCNTLVTIICSTHGEFKQTPTNHLHPKGFACHKCGKLNHTTEMFIEKAEKIHGNKYDYSKVDYVNSATKVIIICKKHGEFLQSPNSHISKKQGCSACFGMRKDTTKSFIEKAIKIHGDKYDYSKLKYVNSPTQIIIICREHGEFKQRAGDHINNKAGCPTCKGIKPYTTKTFIEKVQEYFDGAYCYDKVKYVNSSTKVIITCKIHGDFKITPGHHLRRIGCKRCGRIVCAKKLMSNKKDFIKQAKLIHGNIFTYENVQYNGNKIKVTITCKKHGDFKVTPHNHLNRKSGCPRCYSGYSKKQMEWLHFLELTEPIQHMENDGEYIIPNTRYSVDGFNHETKTVYEFHGDFWHGNPTLFHHQKVNKVSSQTFGKLFKNTLHKEFLLQKLGYNYKCIWEHQWDRAINALIVLQHKWRNRNRL